MSRPRSQWSRSTTPRPGVARNERGERVQGRGAVRPGGEGNRQSPGGADRRDADAPRDLLVLGGQRDRDQDGISIAANALSLNGGTIRATDGTTDADLTHGAAPADPNRKVDGSRTAL